MTEKHNDKTVKTLPAIRTLGEPTHVQLATPLTAERRAELHDDLAKSTHECIGLRVEKKRQAKIIDAKIEERERRMAIASEALVTGIEMKSVPVVKEIDSIRKLMIVRRTDDNSVVSERPMMREEIEAYCVEPARA